LSDSWHLNSVLIYLQFNGLPEHDCSRLKPVAGILQQVYSRATLTLAASVYTVTGSLSYSLQLTDIILLHFLGHEL